MKNQEVANSIYMNKWQSSCSSYIKTKDHRGQSCYVPSLLDPSGVMLWRDSQIMRTPQEAISTADSERKHMIKLFS